MFTSCSYSSEILENEKKIIFELQNGGYWTNEYSGRLILQGLKTYRLDRDHWQKMYYEKVEASDIYADKVMERLNKIEEDFNAREKAWKKELRKSRLPGFGVFAGAGYGTGGNSLQAVFGAGIVWKLW